MAKYSDPTILYCGDPSFATALFLRGRKEAGDKVVVIGGGLTGCEIAYDLALKGKEVTIIEMLDDILKIRELAAPNAMMLRDLLRYHHVNVVTNAAITEITKSGVQ